MQVQADEHTRRSRFQQQLVERVQRASPGAPPPAGAAAAVNAAAVNAAAVNAAAAEAAEAAAAQLEVRLAETRRKMGEMKDKAMGLLANKDAQLRQLQAQLEAHQGAAERGG